MSRISVLLVGLLLISTVGCESSYDVSSSDGGGGAQTAATTTDPVTGVTDVDLSGAEVKGGWDFTQARTTTTLTEASMDGSGAVTLSWVPHSWPSRDAHTDGVYCAVWRNANGGWVGGYVDYLPKGSGYTFPGAGENIRNGYGGPASGQEIGFFILSSDRSERSNVVITTWP